MSFLLVLVGIGILIKGADFFVDGAAGIAKKWGLPSFVIGVTIVAIGTSAPELFVNIQSALSGHANLAIGNVLGSNISNILLICGICIIASKGISVDKTILQNFAISLLFTIVVVFLTLHPQHTLTSIGGIILLILLAGYIYYLIATREKNEAVVEKYHTSFSILSLWSVLGVILLVIGGNIVVDNAINLAKQLGISERVIGLTIVAIGTSLPELVTTLIAIKKKENALGIGNIIGSNICNIGMILGITSLIAPIHFTLPTYIDMGVLLFASVLPIIIILWNKKYSMPEIVGWLFVSFYSVYIIGSLLL